MMQDHNSIKKFRRLALTASILVYVVIVMGGIVRATGLGQACQGWPLCEGSLFPPLNLEAGLAYLHRLDTALLVLALGGAAYVGQRRLPGEAWLRRPVYAALGLVGIQILLGAVIVLRDRPADVGALHLGLSLLVQALVVIPVVAALYLEKGALSTTNQIEKHSTIRLSFRAPFARLSLWTLGAAVL
jgi:heme A synthase